jgi:hypothetical protein
MGRANCAGRSIAPGKTHAPNHPILLPASQALHSRKRSEWPVAERGLPPARGDGRVAQRAALSGDPNLGKLIPTPDDTQRLQGFA